MSHLLCYCQGDGGDSGPSGPPGPQVNCCTSNTHVYIRTRCVPRIQYRIFERNILFRDRTCVSAYWTSLAVRARRSERTATIISFYRVQKVRSVRWDQKVQEEKKYRHISVTFSLAHKTWHCCSCPGSERRHWPKRSGRGWWRTGQIHYHCIVTLYVSIWVETQFDTWNLVRVHCIHVIYVIRANGSYAYNENRYTCWLWRVRPKRVNIYSILVRQCIGCCWPHRPSWTSRSKGRECTSS